MVGIPSGDALLRDLDQCDLLGLDPATPVDIGELQAAARRVSTLLHPDRSRGGPVGAAAPYTIQQANALRDFLNGQDGNDHHAPGRRAQVFYATARAGHRSRWNPQGTTATGRRLTWADAALLRPVPGRTPPPSTGPPPAGPIILSSDEEEEEDERPGERGGDGSDDDVRVTGERRGGQYAFSSTPRGRERFDRPDGFSFRPPSSPTEDRSARPPPPPPPPPPPDPTGGDPRLFSLRTLAERSGDTTGRRVAVALVPPLDA
jgi:hypothetical protein